MRALPVQPEPLWRTDFRQRIAVSLWFLPTILAAAALAAAHQGSWLDAPGDAPEDHGSGLLNGFQALAQQLGVSCFVAKGDGRGFCQSV